MTSITRYESALVEGDLSRLTPDERQAYYMAVCESLDLNPLTKPFAFIKLNGQLTLYATRGATDQLRAKHGVSLTVVSRTIENDVLTVVVRATLPDGRADEEIGAVSLKGLAGEALANAHMKALTKAKRRATLSIVGLGLPDESDAPAGATYIPLDPPPPARPALPDAAPADDRAKRQRQAYVARFTELVEQALALDIDPFEAYEGIGPHNYATVLTNNQMETIATEIKRMIAEAEAAQLFDGSDPNA